jgi:hypothetical protein
MEKILAEEERQLMKDAVEPTVSIILPFEPKMSLKTELAHVLKIVMHKVEKELQDRYPAKKAAEVITKLEHLVHNLNFNTHKKSIAIFVSPLTEKVFYLDVPVEEKIAIDSTFEIRDLIYNKRQDKEYLILLLSAKFSKMYIVDHSGIHIIKSNLAQNVQAYERDMPERVPHFDDPHEHKEILIDKFLKHMDDGLSLMLKAFPLPVFVIGPAKILGHFKNFTKNERNIAGFVQDDYENLTEFEIEKSIQPHIADWNKIKQAGLLKQINQAMSDQKLAYGIREVIEAATHKNTRLLIVEKNYTHRVNEGAHLQEAGSQKVFYVKDVVGDVIEKVLESGGDIEFVDEGLLTAFQHIALIKFY